MLLLYVEGAANNNNNNNNMDQQFKTNATYSYPVVVSTLLPHFHRQNHLPWKRVGQKARYRALCKRNCLTKYLECSSVRWVSAGTTSAKNHNMTSAKNHNRPDRQARHQCYWESTRSSGVGAEIHSYSDLLTCWDSSVNRPKLNLVFIDSVCFLDRHYP